MKHDDWTPAYESVLEALKEAEEKHTRFEKTLLALDTFVAMSCLLFLAYLVF